MLFGPSMKNLVKKQLSFPEEKKTIPGIQGGGAFRADLSPAEIERHAPVVIAFVAKTFEQRNDNIEFILLQRQIFEQATGT